ncbi:SDR family NAD(P)-dependent oxidoreductase [Stieleria varia]|uniref:3-oxoacyl-[acyl-carrier-protein] reductase FabG n=1 Tax=Stieleria varia TaxID=2528005 RepID=A0A5C6B280_9BACT|nr:glucose 1-dehydrogenase [Stieleria varia]TWU06020.1 3-oxoacyl-[acyl-carrier-protein] reductase FabG [Stieleria varia]
MPKRKEKVAVVTGASKGIGAGIAKELAAAGTAVVVNYASDQSGAEAVVNEIIQAGGQAIAVAGDVSRSTDVDRLFSQATATYGRLDIVVNNAGVYRPGTIDSITEEDFHWQFNTNVLGPLMVVQKSLKHFDPNGGSVVNIGSGASSSHPAGYSIYSASKAALDAITGVLAKELAQRNIRVNSVNPGATLSEGTKAAGLYGVNSDIEKQLVAMTPLGRVGTPADIAKIVTFLTSDEAGWLTGEVIIASGGLR